MTQASKTLLEIGGVLCSETNWAISTKNIAAYKILFMLSESLLGTSDDNASCITHYQTQQYKVLDTGYICRSWLCSVSHLADFGSFKHWLFQFVHQ